MQNIKITDAASAQIQKIAKDAGPGVIGIRVGVQGGGCAGLSYILDFETEVHEGDRVYAISENVDLFIDKKSYLFLAGTELDWSGGLNGNGFEFNNFPFEVIPEGMTLVADMSSNIASKPIDWSKYGVIYAGA